MYQVGWDKQEILIEPKGLAMFGYGQWTHRAYEKRTVLYARSVVIQQGDDTPLMISCLDFGCITYAMRSRSVAALQQHLGNQFKPERLVLMATHTHSGPGGCAYEVLYNVPTPGFVPEHLDAVVDAIVNSILNAFNTAQPTDIKTGTAIFPNETPVAWNRSIQAYNRNLDTAFVPEDQTHLALNREMQVLGFYRQQQLCALISFFGVHATCLGNTLKAHDGDNKGYAAHFAEQQLLQQGVEKPVCIFAQATAGDVSPHFHGKDQVKIRKQIKGENEYLYAQQNGRYQSELAFEALQTVQPLAGVQQDIDAVLEYVDLSDVEISDEFSGGQTHARTSIPCHGSAFLAGTPVDGVGAPALLIKIMNGLSHWFRQRKLNSSDEQERQYYQQLYASQGPKQIIIESGRHRVLGLALDKLPAFLDPLIGELKRQTQAGAVKHSPMVPSVVPVQLIKVAGLIVVCSPGEFTTSSGRRVMQTVMKNLHTLDISQVWFASYCNDYMGYVTTYEEYQQQAYEGGHTLYGQWTLSAFQMQFQRLAQQLCLPAEQRQLSTCLPPGIPQVELEQRTNYGKINTAVRHKEMTS